MSRDLNREHNLNLLEWEKIEADIQGGKHSYRAKVPGGWLLRMLNSMAHPQDCDYLFLSDPKYTWGAEIAPKE